MYSCRYPAGGGCDSVHLTYTLVLYGRNTLLVHAGAGASTLSLQGAGSDIRFGSAGSRAILMQHTPQSTNAVLLVSLSHPTAIKEALLDHAIMSAPHMPVVVLLDGTQREYRSYAYKINQRWRGRRTAYVTTVHAPKGQFAESFNVSRGYKAFCCPGKSEAAEWCAAAGYEYCWHMEDDVYVRNMSALELAYRDSAVDLLPHSVQTKHPFWVSAPPGASFGRGWADRSHLLLHAPPDTPRFCGFAMYRMSRAFARTLTRTALDEGKASHCEIWYPYLIYKHPHLSMASMLSKHLQGSMSLNRGLPCHLFRGLHEVRDYFMAHPVKYFKKVSAPGGPETEEQCKARAQREHADVPRIVGVVTRKASGAHTDTTAPRREQSSIV